MGKQQNHLDKKLSNNYLISERGEVIEGRVPPHSKDLEEIVLGAMLLEREALSSVIDIISTAHFYFPEHQIIFNAIASLYADGKPVDLLTINNELRNTGKLQDAGGSFYLAQLTNKLSSAANIEYYSRILIQKYVQRALIKVGGEIATKGYDDGRDAFELLDEAETELYTIKNESLKKSYASIETLIGRVITDLENRSEEGNGGVTGVSTGFLELDRFTAGWQPSDLIIMAARPGMGKTAMALSFLRSAVDEKLGGKDRTALMFSLEMSDVQLVQRMVSSEVEISGEQIKKGQLTEQEFKRLHTGTQELSQSKIFIDDTPQLKILDLMAKCRRVASNYGLHLVIVDYLQLLRADDRGVGNREQEIATISRSLKGLAKELSVPVIALAQLSREVEKRAVKKPQLSDLRESGSIEQDADLVLFLYRSQYYTATGQNSEDPKGKNKQSENAYAPEIPNLTEIVVAKNRHGTVGEARVKFIGQFSKFVDLNDQERQLLNINNSESEYGTAQTVQSRMNSDVENPFETTEEPSSFVGSDDFLDMQSNITEE